MYEQNQIGYRKRLRDLAKLGSAEAVQQQPPPPPVKLRRGVAAPGKPITLGQKLGLTRIPQQPIRPRKLRSAVRPPQALGINAPDTPDVVAAKMAAGKAAMDEQPVTVVRVRPPSGLLPPGPPAPPEKPPELPAIRSPMPTIRKAMDDTVPMPPKPPEVDSDSDDLFGDMS